MIEFIEHLFGFCGESHINIFTLILMLPLISYITFKYLKYER
jgi:hypothetical protein